MLPGGYQHIHAQESGLDWESCSRDAGDVNHVGSWEAKLRNVVEYHASRDLNLISRMSRDCIPDRFEALGKLA